MRSYDGTCQNGSGNPEKVASSGRIRWSVRSGLPGQFKPDWVASSIRICHEVPLPVRLFLRLAVWSSAIFSKKHYPVFVPRR